MDPMIKLTNLEKSYPTKPSPTFVLRQITLDVAEGEFLTVMGPSGAGKSTLLSILGLYDSAWEDQGREIMELFRKLNNDGTTIVQVTHNHDWAAYGRRIIKLQDGWMAK
jgi:ABC-type lipoprotein export system ATPase subunit